MKEGLDGAPCAEKDEESTSVESLPKCRAQEERVYVRRQSALCAAAEEYGLISNHAFTVQHVSLEEIANCSGS